MSNLHGFTNVGGCCAFPNIVNHKVKPFSWLFICWRSGGHPSFSDTLICLIYWIIDRLIDGSHLTLALNTGVHCWVNVTSICECFTAVITGININIMCHTSFQEQSWLCYARMDWLYYCWLLLFFVEFTVCFKSWSQRKWKWLAEKTSHLETVLLNSGTVFVCRRPIMWEMSGFKSSHLITSYECQYVTQCCVCAGKRFSWETLSDSDWNERFFYDP